MREESHSLLSEQQRLVEYYVRCATQQYDIDKKKALENVEQALAGQPQGQLLENIYNAHKNWALNKVRALILTRRNKSRRFTESRTIIDACYSNTARTHAGTYICN